MAESTLTIKIQDEGGTPGGKSGAGTTPAPASPKPTPVPLPKPKPVDLPYYPPGPLPSAANLDPAKEKPDKKSSGFDGRSIIAGITETLADSVRNPMTSMQGIVGKILESKDHNFGYNAQTEEFGDMFKFGVIDPTKVVRTALRDAASVAGLMITTEAMIAELPKKNAGGAPGGGMPGGMGDMDF